MTFLRNAIEQVYRLEDNRVRAERGQSINIDRELLQWMVLIGKPLVNEHVLNNHIWFIILCHWATTCDQDNGKLRKQSGH